MAALDFTFAHGLNAGVADVKPGASRCLCISCGERWSERAGLEETNSLIYFSRRQPSYLVPIRLRRYGHRSVVLSRRPCSDLTSSFHYAPQCRKDCTRSPFVLQPRPVFRKTFIGELVKHSHNKKKTPTKTVHVSSWKVHQQIFTSHLTPQ